MIVLGLNCFHGDSSAALVRDGELVAAAEEERFRRVKHWAGFPSQAIKFCLAEAGVKVSEVDHIAINQDSRANLVGKLHYILAMRPDPRLVWNRWKNRRARVDIARVVEQTVPSAAFDRPVHAVEHHVAHLSSAFHVSPFERAVVLSVDGFGDFASAAWGVGEGTMIRVDGRVYFPHSLGIFYSALTQFLGFPHYGDEYKVMGLAPYGEPNYLEQFREVVRIRPEGSFRLNLKYFRHHTGNVSYTWQDCAPEVGLLYRRPLIDLLRPARRPADPIEQKHKDIARSVQATYEKAFFALLQKLHKEHPSDNLAIAGGCAMNSVANGKIYRRSPFKKMYCPAAAGDSGGAIGAAAVVQMELEKGAERRAPAEEVKSSEIGDGNSEAQLQSPIYDLRSKHSLDSAYLGPESNEEEIHALIDWKKKQIADAGCSIAYIGDEEELIKRAAQAIADGKIIGWFQGRMEWGPRALGNRSILADPRKAEIKDVLNAKIKRRESFRPFAPSILREAVAEWFETDDDVPFMMKVFQIRSKYRDMIPAVIHVDGTGRLQTVHRETNPRFYRLIEQFRELTGIPVILNTSFNENEPIVCYPEEALDCFLRTEMDSLVLGSFWVVRS